MKLAVKISGCQITQPVSKKRGCFHGILTQPAKKGLSGRLTNSWLAAIFFP
jgi:hypothetical protein